MLTSSCDRRFPALEDLFCLGCNPLESIYTNVTKKEIYICRGYAEYFWNSTDLDKPSTVFDSCGFRANDNLQKYATQNFIMPSKVFIKKSNYYFSIFFYESILWKKIKFWSYKFQEN